jgi:hypothetical protein
MEALRLICQAVDNGTVTRQHALAGVVSGRKAFVSKWKLCASYAKLLIMALFRNSTPLLEYRILGTESLHLKMEGLRLICQAVDNSILFVP